MKQHAGEMKAEGRGAPQRAIDGVREIDDGTRHVVPEDAAKVCEGPNRLVFDHGMVIVVHESIVECVRVHQNRHRGGRATGDDRTRVGPLHHPWLVVMYDEPVMRSLRILHVTPYFKDAWAYGGIPRLAHALTRELAQRGHSVTVCTTDVCDSQARLPRQAMMRKRFQSWKSTTPDGVAVHVFPNLSNRLAYHLQFFVPVGLDRYMADHASSFDVAHLHAHRNLPGVIAARHLRAAGVPYVLTPNGTAPRIERRRVAKLAFDVLGGHRVFRDATRLLAVTHVEAQQLHNLGADHTRIRIVPNPIDLQEFEQPCERGAFRRNHALGAAPIVLFLGKLTPRKRLDVLIRAFHQLGNVDAQLVIAGNDMGAGRTARELVGRLGLDSRTTFVGLLRDR